MTAHNGPRLSKRMREQLNQQDTKQVAGEPESEVSATEGQETASSEPLEGVLDPSEQAERGSNLDPETVQILDSEEGLRCREEIEKEEDFEPTAEDKAAYSEAINGSVDLAKILQASAEQETGASPGSIEAILGNPGALRNIGKSLNLVDQSIETARKVAETLKPGQSLRFDAAGNRQQPDGTLVVALTISEEYIAGVEEAARTDGRTVDQWCTERFTEYLEAYYTQPKGR